jgi:hypothetical protein
MAASPLDPAGQPTAAAPTRHLLERHTMRNDAMPARYAGPERLESLARLAARAAAVMSAAAARAHRAGDPALLDTFDVYRDISESDL